MMNIDARDRDHGPEAQSLAPKATHEKNFALTRTKSQCSEPVG
jgi:hypothetical protein